MTDYNMNPYDIAMYKILVLLDCPSKRLMQQKIYLLQKLGVDMGRHFKWWNNPCDTDLYDYVKNLHEKVDKIPDVMVKDRVYKACMTINSLPGRLKFDLDDLDKYILISSVVFWSENAYEDKTPKGIMKKVQSLKPNYTKKQIKAAYRLADELGMIKETCV